MWSSIPIRKIIYKYKNIVKQTWIYMKSKYRNGWNKTKTCYIILGKMFLEYDLSVYDWFKVVPQCKGKTYLYKDKCNNPP